MRMEKLQIRRKLIKIMLIRDLSYNFYATLYSIIFSHRKKWKESFIPGTSVLFFSAREKERNVRNDDKILLFLIKLKFSLSSESSQTSAALTLKFFDVVTLMGN